jgi:hypothetical protein
MRIEWSTSGSLVRTQYDAIERRRSGGRGEIRDLGKRHADLGTEGVRDHNLLSFCIVFAIEIGSAARSELSVVQNRG